MRKITNAKIVTPNEYLKECVNTDQEKEDYIKEQEKQEPNIIQYIQQQIDMGEDELKRIAKDIESKIKTTTSIPIGTIETHVNPKEYILILQSQVGILKYILENWNK